MNRQNNVQVSGRVIHEKKLLNNNVELLVDVTTILVIAIIELEKWEKFKQNFPNNNMVTIYGNLQSRKEVYGSTYFIEGTGVCCFHNILGNESEIQFYGNVKLKKKFDFDTASKLFLKRMLFEVVPSTTCSDSAVFEATALRSVVPYFDTIEEGEEMLLKANYVLDNSGNPPYWRIKHAPQL